MVLTGVCVRPRGQLFSDIGFLGAILFTIATTSQQRSNVWSRTRLARHKQRRADTHSPQDENRTRWKSSLVARTSNVIFKQHVFVSRCCHMFLKTCIHSRLRPSSTRCKEDTESFLSFASWCQFGNRPVRNTNCVCWPHTLTLGGLTGVRKKQLSSVSSRAICSHSLTHFRLKPSSTRRRVNLSCCVCVMFETCRQESVSGDHVLTLGGLDAFLSL